jgi:hypothetical protein
MNLDLLSVCLSLAGQALVRGAFEFNRGRQRQKARARAKAHKGKQA